MSRSRCSPHLGYLSYTDTYRHTSTHIHIYYIYVYMYILTCIVHTHTNTHIYIYIYIHTYIYKAHSPVTLGCRHGQYIVDPFVKLYDVRTMRMMNMFQVCASCTSPPAMGMHCTYLCAVPARPGPAEVHANVFRCAVRHLPGRPVPDARHQQYVLVSPAFWSGL